MFQLERQIARDIKAFDAGISECLILREKIPVINESCKLEIKRAKKEEEWEKRENIIKSHEKQIEENLYHGKMNDEKLVQLYEIKERTKKLLPGWKSIFLYF